MLGVEVHMPIEEAEERVQHDGSAAQAEIRHVVAQPRVLSVVAEVLQPPAVERRERDEDRHHPLAAPDRYADEKGVTHEQNPRPVEQPAPLFRVRRRKQSVLPIAFDPSQTEPDRPLERAIESQRVHDCVLEEIAERQFLRQHDFQIVRRVQRVLVMLGVARPETDVVVPADEGVNPQEERVEES